MKTFFKKFTLFTVITFFLSCSKEDINTGNNNILGVWEATSENSPSNQVYNLVFGENNTGLFIIKIEDESTVTSSANSFNWLKNNNEIVLDNTSMETIYTFSNQNEFAITSSSGLRFIKVSDDYLKFY